MASAQVLPNSAIPSRKQGHLEAGKKRLEEFRKKKAQGRAKKAASTGQLISPDIEQSENFCQNHEQVKDGAKSGSIVDSSVLGTADETKAAYSSHTIDIGSSNKPHAGFPVLADNGHASYGDSVQNARKEESKLCESSGFSEPINGYYDQWKVKSGLSQTAEEKIVPSDCPATDQPNSSNPVNTNQNVGMSIDHFSFDSFHKARSGEDLHMRGPETSGANLVSTSEKLERVSGHKSWLGNPSTSAGTSGIHEESTSGMGLYRPGSMFSDSVMDSDMGGRKNSNSMNRHLNVDSARRQASEVSYNDSTLSFKSSQHQYPLPPTAYGISSGRSRPSFLDNLGVSRISSASHVLYGDPEKTNSPASVVHVKTQSTGSLPSSSTEQSFAGLGTPDQSFKSSIPDFLNHKELGLNSFVPSSDSKQSKGAEEHHAHRDEFTSKKDEDFAALEQHIEDLTQEKFSLQRALETSRTLAESLAAENSSLTDSYNQQGKVVNQLRSDMERLQDEIKAQLNAFESVRMEYTNAQLECNAADERARILASEVIGLEEKALRLRSNELKLEKQLENLNSEVTSYKRKVSILEKERQDFQSTIDALQEEKKLLQSKLRKASTNGKVIDARMASSGRNVSTSTEDLGAEHLNLINGEISSADTMHYSTINQSEESMSIILSTDASGDIPHDQLRMIDNITSLISELALEREELIRALTIESSNCSELKDLNNDLSQKLEAQTQRLELLTAQRMANENLLTKPIDTHSIQDTAQYADEGDEVVERVLGWIMKLFPGGPSKRRTSKLL